MLAKLIVRVILNAGVIYFADSFIEGFTFSGGFVILFVIGAMLAVFQSFIYPVIKIIAFPLVLLTFGLFGFVVNAFMLWVIAYFVPEFAIDGIVPLVLLTLILSAVNVIFAWLL